MLYAVLTTIGNSFTQQISTAMEHQDVDIAVQAKYAPTPLNSIIDSETIKTISQIEGVTSVATLLVTHKRINGKNTTFILGVSSFATFAQRLGFSIIKGRAPEDLDREIAIGEKMAKVFKLSVGDKIKLNGEKNYKIVGIYSSWLSFLNAGVITDLESVQGLEDKAGKASMLFLKLSDTTNTPKVIAHINALFPKMRAAESQQMPDTFGPLKSVFYFSKIVSILTLIIAVAVLINTFIMATNERTKEIGILSTIGWSRPTIVAIFLVEALTLSLAGGIIGYFGAYPIMIALQTAFPITVIFIPDTLGINLFFNVILMSLVIGVLSTLFPAFYGTKIQISRATRYE